MDLSKIKLRYILLFLGIVILIIPPILTTSYFFEMFDFSDTGQIGDTLGGITAPFINGIAAILVFIAFKEQVKANDLIKEQQYFQHIQEQVHRLEDDFIDIPNVINEINNDLLRSSQLAKNIENGKQVLYSINSEHLNKAIYSISIFQQTIELIDKMESNKVFMKNKLRILYAIIYKDNFTRLHKTMNGIIHMKSNVDSYVLELIFQIQKLNEQFED
jgi:hypothetical protein